MIERTSSLPRVLFKRWSPECDLPVPRYASAGAAGFDLQAWLPARKTLAPGEWALIPTGFAVAIPTGYEMQVRPRSGLAAKFGISLVNTPGTIDCDYRGQVQVCLINHGRDVFEVSPGDRIAQGVIAAAPQFPIVEVSELDATVRGEGGFGSTGKA